MKLIIKNGKIVLESKIIESDVYIDDGIIKDVNKDIQVDGAEVIDASNLYVSPGFTDIHTHGGNGHDYMEGTFEAFKQASDLHFSHGTTSIVPTTVASTYDLTIKFLDAFKKNKVL